MSSDFPVTASAFQSTNAAAGSGGSNAFLTEFPLDFTPVLNNPKSVSNIALRLRAMPKNVEVKEDTSEISEVDQGLVIHHVLSYRILPGKCADPSVHAQLAQAGVACFTKESASQRLAEFATPGHARYVADPVKRQAAIAAYQQRSAQADAEANTHIADLRKSFADPKQRATLTAQLGAAEVARISNLRHRKPSPPFRILKNRVRPRN